GRARHGAVHKEKVIFLIDPRDANIPHSDTSIAHVSGHSHTLQDARRICGRTDRTRGPMEHRSMRCAASTKVMTLDEASKTATFARPYNVHQFIRIEDVDHHLIAGIPRLITLDRNFSSESSRRNLCFLEMTGHGFIDALGLDELDEPELHGIVPIGLLCLLLNYDARTCLNHGHGDNCSIILKQLRHTDLFSQ